MEIYQPPAAYMIRDFRDRHSLTLREAAPLMDLSPSVLSRKERGEKPVERTDVRNAVDAYQLTPWEACELWLSAGFVPEKCVPVAAPACMEESTRALLDEIVYPACVTDPLDYLRGWNRVFEALWQPSQIASDTPHSIDLLFSPQADHLLRTHWAQHVQQALRIFYHKTLPVAHTPRFRKLMHDLRNTHGELFVEQWNEAQQYQYTGDDAQDVSPRSCLMTLEHEQPDGRIEYLCTRTQFDCLVGHELIVYMPLGRTPHEQYMQWWEERGDSQLYYNKTADVDACATKE